MENQEPITPESPVEENSGISFIDDATVEQMQQEQAQEQAPEQQVFEQPATEQPQEQPEPETSGYEENYRVDLEDNPVDQKLQSQRARMTSTRHEHLAFLPEIYRI